MAEWNSSRTFAVRKQNLIDGTGSAQRLNDQYFLKQGTTVFDDNQADTVNGAQGNNWIILTSLYSSTTGETSVPIPSIQASILSPRWR